VFACRRIPEIVEATEGKVCDVTNKARLDQMALARYIIDPSFGIDGATGTDTCIPGLVLRGDGNILHRGENNNIAPTIVNVLKEVPYLQQKFYGKQPPTDKFLPRYTEEEDAALNAEWSPAGGAGSIYYLHVYLAIDIYIQRHLADLGCLQTLLTNFYTACTPRRVTEYRVPCTEN
jgi:hypothetical protein